MRTAEVDVDAATVPTVAHPVPPSGVARGRPLPVEFSVVLAVVLVGATAYGLLADVAYRVAPGVRATLPDVLRGQDLLTLATVPLLVWAAVRARAGSLRAHLLWAGLLLYYAYSHGMYAFAPFTDVFLLYVAVMGMASYGLLDGVLRLRMGVVAAAFERAPRRPAGVFLIAVAVLFVGMWLAMIVPAVPGGLPAGRQTYDIASAVHILDLAFVLPLLLATGVMLWRGHVAGPALTAVLLCLKVTLALALLSMNLAFVARPNIGESVLWATIAAVAGGWLVVGARRVAPPDAPWLRRSIWCTDTLSPGPRQRRGRRQLTAQEAARVAVQRSAHARDRGYDRGSRGHWLVRQHPLVRTVVVWAAMMVVLWVVFTLAVVTHPAAWTGVTKQPQRGGWPLLWLALGTNGFILAMIAVGNLFVRFGGLLTPGLLVLSIQAVVIGWTAGTNTFAVPFASVAAANGRSYGSGCGRPPRTRWCAR